VAKDIAGRAVASVAVADVLEVLLLSNDRVVPHEYSRAVWVPQAGLGAFKPHGAGSAVLDALLLRGEDASAVIADASNLCFVARNRQG
jgi:hypothetical protein